MVYVLNMKERIKAAIKRVHYAILPRKTAEAFISECHYINTVFFGFLSGKLLDSLIIGIICFVALSIMNMPYTMLVSVLVGVTNIIPFFGPFIGAIPSIVLILFVSPIKSFEFMIFILALQQFDGNILGPKILGNSTGVSSFEVLFSILLFGGLFGFVGMIIGVPLWAVLSDLFERWLNWLLGRKKLVLDKNAAVVSDGHAPDANTPDPPAL
jgi:predicted PurR-regulated permease PerM